MTLRKKKPFGFRTLLKGATTLFFGGLATNVTASSLGQVQDADWSLSKRDEDAVLCTPEILALADLGVLPGTHEGCISDLDVDLQTWLDLLANQPVQPGNGNTWLRTISHNANHYDNGGGSDQNNGHGNGDQDAPGGSNGDQDAPGGSELNNNAENSGGDDVGNDSGNSGNKNN